jgi:hypothetical protein
LTEVHEFKEEFYRIKLSEFEKLRDLVRYQEEELSKYAEEPHFEQDLQLRIKRVALLTFRLNNGH